MSKSIRALIAEGRGVFEARPIPLDRSELKTATKTIEEKLLKYLKYHPGESVLSKVLRQGSVQFGISLTHPFKGEVIKPLVRILSATGRGKGLYQGGKHRLSGERHIVDLFFDADATVEELVGAFRFATVCKLIRTTLAHELTHAVDPSVDRLKGRYIKAKPGSSSETYGAYVNQPVEYNAFIQQVLDEILNSAWWRNSARYFRRVLGTGTSKQDRFKRVLKISDTWKAKGEVLTRRNRAKALKTIYQAVEPYLVVEGRKISEIKVFHGGHSLPHPASGRMSYGGGHAWYFEVPASMELDPKEKDPPGKARERSNEQWTTILDMIRKTVSTSAKGKRRGKSQ